MTSLTKFFALAPLPHPNPFLLLLIGSHALATHFFQFAPLQGPSFWHFHWTSRHTAHYNFATANYHSRNS